MHAAVYGHFGLIAYHHPKLRAMPVLPQRQDASRSPGDLLDLAALVQIGALVAAQGRKYPKIFDGLGAGLCLKPRRRGLVVPGCGRAASFPPFGEGGGCDLSPGCGLLVPARLTEPC